MPIEISFKFEFGGKHRDVKEISIYIDFFSF